MCIRDRLTLMLLAAHPDKVGGGISYMQACFGKLSKKYKVKKVGPEEALKKFAKKRPGPAELRQRQIDNIKKSNNVPVLAFTHPRDKYEGLLSDWLEEVPGVKRIVISKNYKVNGKKIFIYAITSFSIIHYQFKKKCKRKVYAI